MTPTLPDALLSERHELSRALDECLSSLEPARASVRERPGDSAAGRRLACLLERTGNLMGALGDFAAGLARIEEGAGIRARLAQAAPRDPELARELAASVENAGNMHAALGDYSSALSCSERTLIILRGLRDSSPVDRSLAVGVLRETEKQAGILHILGRKDEALALRREAEAGWVAMAEADPSDETAAQAAVTAAQQTATVLVTRGDLAEALEAYGRVLASLEKARVPEGEGRHMKRRRAGVLTVMGAVRRQMGDPAGAADDFRAALALHESLGESPQWADDLAELRALLASVE